jgi:hypothetical protein
MGLTWVQTGTSNLLRRTSAHLGPPRADNLVVLGLSLRQGILIGWAILMLAGIAYVVAPERTLRWVYPWNDRKWRWITFGRVKRTPSPKLIRGQTAIRVMPYVGAICAVVGGVTLLWPLFAAFN